MGAGDILLFYVSERKELTSLGVVETIDRNVCDPDIIIRRVGKRTVYSRSEIEEIALKPATVILFRQHLHLRNYLSLRQLKTMGVLTGPPQSIVQITDKSYEKIKEKGGIDERFTIN